MAPITRPLVTSTPEEMQNLLAVWMGCHLICPIRNCNGRTPGPKGHAEGVTLQARASKKDLDDEGKLVFKEGVETIKPVERDDKKFIKEVVINDGAKVIGGEAFGYCEELTTVSMTSTVVEIDWGAFYW